MTLPTEIEEQNTHRFISECLTNTLWRPSCRTGESINSTALISTHNATGDNVGNRPARALRSEMVARSNHAHRETERSTKRLPWTSAERVTDEFPRPPYIYRCMLPTTEEAQQKRRFQVIGDGAEKRSVKALESETVGHNEHTHRDTEAQHNTTAIGLQGVTRTQIFCVHHVVSPTTKNSTAVVSTQTQSHR